LKDPRSLQALVEVVNDADDVVRAGAIEALGEIGDAGAVPALIPLLGQTKKVGVRQVRGLAAAALGKVGAQDVVDAFDQALQGHVDPLKELAEGAHRSEIVQALVYALDAHATAAKAATGLAALGAREVLPKLRSLARGFGVPESVREACRSAVAELEAQAALPRPARADPEGRTDTLPRPIAEPEGGVETLPRAVEEEE
jgi:HEAT repeat protein